MGQVVDIADPADSRLDPYLRLREASLRRPAHAELFIAEGPLVVRRAVAAGYPPASFFLAPRWVDELADVWGATPAPVYRAPADLVEQVTGFHVHRGALAALHRTQRWSVADVLAGNRVVVAEDLVDHANLGTILRSAAGLGWDGVLVTAGSADPLYRRAVKTSMGAVFTLPWARLEPGADVAATLHGAGFTVVALALRDGAVTLDAVPRDGRLAVLLGSEGPGLSDRLIAGAEHVVAIPMAGGIDSLNVGAAAAIALHALRP
ncbi:MAG: RNA methyltransferase [Propionibacteriaceae bacterium]|jgi:tRNA G18 (ribose-2'-O)-methylase SpoU|nr:RNA methyltransferase [Propionibacteriaceae bacterium]